MKNLIPQLDQILEISNQINIKYRALKEKNKELEVQLSDLKVEADQYINQINLLQQELENREKEVNNSMLLATDKISNEEIAVLKQKQGQKNKEVKRQLDIFIDEIDQCIQIAQKKE